jgi:hypothetical protein
MGWPTISLSGSRANPASPWLHHHPNRGIAIDRLPSPEDFGHVTCYQRAGDAPKSLTSNIAWTDPASKIPFETEFGVR